MDVFHVTSTAFKNEERLPRKHTADGGGQQKDMSPPLHWHNVPEGAETLAIIAEDVTESSDSPVGTVLWVVGNIPATLKGLPAGFNHKEVEGQKDYGEIQEGVNDLKVPGYRGPTPHASGDQRIEFRLYALDSTLKLGKKFGKAKLEEAMEGHILAETLLVALYHGGENYEKSGFFPVRGASEGQSLSSNMQT